MTSPPAFVFREIAATDLPMLHAWLHRPHVAEWWLEPSTLEELAEDYLSPSAGQSSGTIACIVEIDGEAIGFIQFYVAMGSGEGWWEEETDPGVRVIDQFIADESGLGQGVGSAMVRAFVTQLFADRAVTRVQTDPDPRNARAIRAYEKAGFRRLREVDTPDGRALLMICERPVS